MTHLWQLWEIHQRTENPLVLRMPELNSFTKGITQDVEGILNFTWVDLSWIKETEAKELLTIEQVEKIKTILESDAYKKSAHHQSYIKKLLKHAIAKDKELFSHWMGEPKIEQEMIAWHNERVIDRLTTLTEQLVAIEQLKPSEIIGIQHLSLSEFQSYLENAY